MKTQRTEKKYRNEGKINCSASASGKQHGDKMLIITLQHPSTVPIGRISSEKNSRNYFYVRSIIFI